MAVVPRATVRIFAGGKDYFGVCYNSVQGLRTMFKTFAPHLDVVEMSAATFNPTEWRCGDVIVMPGGRCSIWDTLIGEHIGAIREHVERGGRYLGVCAGAFFASSSSDYRIPGVRPLLRERTLSLVKGSARGPLFGQAPKAVSVQFGDREGEMVMNGGGGFFDIEGAKLLAGFKDGPSAIVSTHEGRVVLCQPHIEYCSIDPERVRYVDLDAFNSKCFIEIVKELGLNAH